jgi:hypothetical protein
MRLDTSFAKSWAIYSKGNLIHLLQVHPINAVDAAEPLKYISKIIASCMIYKNVIYPYFFMCKGFSWHS